MKLTDKNVLSIKVLNAISMLLRCGTRCKSTRPQLSFCCSFICHGTSTRRQRSDLFCLL